MMKLKTELMKLDSYNNVYKDVFAEPNENYNLIEDVITNTMNKSIPTVMQNRITKNTLDYWRHYKVNKMQR